MLKTEKIKPKHSSIRTEMTYNVSSGTLTLLARYDTIPVTTPCAYHCAQLWYTIQRRTVLMVFSLILQTVVISQILCIGEDGVHCISATNSR